jgi:hypothetical protein
VLLAGLLAVLFALGGNKMTDVLQSSELAEPSHLAPQFWARLFVPTQYFGEPNTLRLVRINRHAASGEKER